MSIIGMFKRLIFGASAEPGEQTRSTKTVHTFSESDKLAAQKCAENALRVFTESLTIANKSENLAERELMLLVARETLIELKKMEKQFPFLHLENLQAVETSIAEVEAETRELVKVQNTSLAVGKTVGEMQSEPLSAWGNDDIVTGLQFCATLQLRTPLRVLLSHGEIHTDRKKAPPKIIKEDWEGIWLPKLKTYRELGAPEIPEPPQGTHASDVGQVIPDDYVPFLLAIRKIVELDEPIENRINKLRTMPILAEWKTYVDKRGIEAIIGSFFPEFVDTIPKINGSTIDELSELGLDTPNRIAAAPDETLLSIKGIGQAKLKTIRDYCAGITDNRDADRVENVIR